MTDKSTLEKEVRVKNDHRSKFSNLSNWKEEAWKNQGFNGIRTRDLRDTGAMLYQLSYEVAHWERGQFEEFISPVRSEMTWSLYEIIHMWTAVVDESQERSSSLSSPHGRYDFNKLTSHPKCGFIARLVENRTGITEVMGSNPVEALIFSGFFFPIA